MWLNAYIASATLTYVTCSLREGVVSLLHKSRFSKIKCQFHCPFPSDICWKLSCRLRIFDDNERRKLHCEFNKRVHQLVGLGETLCSLLISQDQKAVVQCRTFSNSRVSWDSNLQPLCGTGHNAGLRHDFGTYSPYSYPIWNRPEAASNIISGTAVDEVDMNS